MPPGLSQEHPVNTARNISTFSFVGPLTRFFIAPTHTEAVLKDAPDSYGPDLMEPTHMEAVFQDPDFEDPAQIPPVLLVLKNINLDFSRVYNL